MVLKSYSPKNVICTNDEGPIQHWDELTVEYEEDRWDFSAAATGEATRTRNESKLGTITLKLPQTSTGNSELDHLTEAHDRVIVGPIPETTALTVKDQWGKSLHYMAEATLIKKPSCNYAKDPGDREWVFKGELTNHIVRGKNT